MAADKNIWWRQGEMVGVHSSQWFYGSSFPGDRPEKQARVVSYQDGRWDQFAPDLESAWVTLDDGSWARPCMLFKLESQPELKSTAPGA